MAYMTHFRTLGNKKAIFQGGAWGDCDPEVLLDLADDTLNSWKEAHHLFNFYQGNLKTVMYSAFAPMRSLVHSVIGSYLKTTATSYTNEAITYCLLQRWIEVRQQQIRLDAVPKRGLEWSAHLNQFRELAGARRFTMTYDPSDHVTPAQTTTIWAPSLKHAQQIAENMTREFGLRQVEVKPYAIR